RVGRGGLEGGEAGSLVLRGAAAAGPGPPPVTAATRAAAPKDGAGDPVVTAQPPGLPVSQADPLGCRGRAEPPIPHSVDRRKPLRLGARLTAAVRPPMLCSPAPPPGECCV